MTSLNEAIQLIEKGDWEAAHSIVQDETSALGSWAHGVIHMLEGDTQNARYWYKRAGKTFPSHFNIKIEIKALKSALTKQP